MWQTTGVYQVHVQLYIENYPFIVCYLKQKNIFPIVKHGYLLYIFYVLIYSTKNDNI